MVGPFRTIIGDAATELAENHHEHAISQPGRGQVIEECPEGRGKFLQRGGLDWKLGAVGVVAALLKVVHARAQAGLDQPRRESHSTGQLELGIGGSAVAYRGEHLQAIRRGVGVQKAAPQELAQLVLSGGGARPCRDRALVAQGTVVEAIERRARRSAGRRGPAAGTRGRSRAARRAVTGRRAAIELAADPPQPVVVAHVEAGRMPDPHAAEVRAIRVRIPGHRPNRHGIPASRICPRVRIIIRPLNSGRTGVNDLLLEGDNEVRRFIAPDLDVSYGTRSDRR